MPGEDISIEIGDESEVTLNIPEFEELSATTKKLLELVKKISEKIETCCNKLVAKIERVSDKLDRTNYILNQLKDKLIKKESAVLPYSASFSFIDDKIRKYDLATTDEALAKKLSLAIVNRYNEATHYMRKISDYVFIKEKYEREKLKTREQIEQMRYNARLLENAGKTQRLILNNLSTIDGRIRSILNQSISSLVVSNREEYNRLREKVSLGKGLTSDEMEKYLQYENEINNSLIKIGKYAAFLTILTQLSQMLKSTLSVLGEMLIYTFRAFIDSISMFLIPIIQLLKYVVLFSWSIAKPYMKAMADILSSNKSATEKLANLAEIQLIQWIDLLGQTIILGFGLVMKPVVELLAGAIKALTGANIQVPFYTYLKNAAYALHTSLLKSVGITTKDDIFGNLLNKIYGGLGKSEVIKDTISTAIGQSTTQTFTTAIAKMVNVKDAIVKNISSSFSEFISNARSLVKDLIEEIKIGFENFFKKTLNPKNLFEFLKGGLKATGIDYIITTLLKNIAGLSSTGAAYLSQFILKALNLGRFAETNPLAFAGISSLVTAIRAFIEGKSMSEVAWSELKQSIVSLENHYKQFYNAFQEVVKGNILAILNLILDGIWIVVDSIGVIINTIIFIGAKIIDTIISKIQGIIKIIVSIINQIKGVLIDILNEIRNLISMVISKIGSFLSNGVSTATNFGEKAMSFGGGILNSIKGGLSSLWNSISSGANYVQDSVKSFVGLKNAASQTNKTLQLQKNIFNNLSSTVITTKTQTNKLTGSIGLFNLTMLLLAPALTKTILKVSDSIAKHKTYASVIDIVSKSIVSSAEYMFNSLERYINKTKEYYNEYKNLKEEYERKLSEIRHREEKTVHIKIDSDILGNHTFTI